MRRPELDLCRVPACLAVVAIHTVMLFLDFSPASPVWAFWNLVSIAVRFGVPLFFLLSGALLLGREEPDLGRHLRRTARLLKLFYLWSAICFGLDACFGRVWADGTPLALRILRGYYHLWYLPALALCYCALPLLHALAYRKREQVRAGALLLAAALAPAALNALPGKGPWLDALFSPYRLGDLAYLVYLPLGRLLSCRKLSNRALTWLGLAALGSVLVFARLNRLASLAAGQAVGRWYGYLTPSAALTACFVFALCRRLEGFAARHAGLLRTLSGCTLGVYLIHPICIDLLRGGGFAFAHYSAALLFPLCWTGFVLLPLGLTLLLKRLPLLRRLVS